MSLATLASARAGLETVRGTNVTPTRILYFSEGGHRQEVGTVSPRERRNSYFRHFRHYAGIERSGFEFSDDVTFDDLIWWANLHIKAVASGTGAGADKTWAFGPAAATDDLKSATIQYALADSIATATGWEQGYCLGESLAIHWPNKSTNEPVSLESTIISPEAASQITAFTGSLSDRATITALSTGTQVFIDTTTIGTTADAQVDEVTFELNNGFVYFDPLNGTNVASAVYRPDSRDWRLNVTRYFASKTELDRYIDKAVRKVRVQTTGPTLGGSAYRIRLDCYGVWEGHEWAEVDGLVKANLVLMPLYDTTATTDFSLEVVNASATIT